MVQYYLCPPIDEIRLAQELAPLVDSFGGTVPSVAHLIELTREHGLAAASMALYEALRVAPQNSEFLSRLDAEPTDRTSTPAGAKVLVVPALFYGHYPEVGGDAVLPIGIARACGFEVETIPILSVGTVTENARIIHDHLEREQAERVWFLTGSKGGADFRAYLQLYAGSAAINRIAGWINICGLVEGCDIADFNVATPARRLKFRALCRVLGTRFELLSELSTTHEYWREPLRPPPHMKVFNLSAIPLPSHIQKSLIKRYRAISDRGPNDSMVACRRTVIDGGLTIPFLGYDHFFRGPNIAPILYRFFNYLRRQ
ncbi:MAG TPA: hypothetical protein PKL28_12115 [Rhodocyclaceae bacterium]|jgi:hypothetical protein|nr:hypothetical protein [Rhodocyclaceae bacterium]